MSPSAVDVQEQSGKRYGFIGIGCMGWPMAMNIAKKMSSGSSLTICDIDQERVESFISAASSVTTGKVQTVKTPKEVAETTDIILTSLPGAKQVKMVFADSETGLLAASKSDRRLLFLETSTYELSAALEVAELVKSSGLGDFLESPISGGPEAAEPGSLAVIVGGDASTFEKALPTLSLIGLRKKIYHCGPIGSGLVAKQANNYAACVAYLGLCEAMNIGVRYGLDPIVLGSIINDSSGQSWNSVNQNPVKGVVATSSATRNFEGGASTELCHGIMASVFETAERVNAKLIVGPLIREIFDQAIEDPRCKGKEYRSIYRLIADEEAKEQKLE